MSKPIYTVIVTEGNLDNYLTKDLLGSNHVERTDYGYVVNRLDIELKPSGDYIDVIVIED